MGFKSDNESNYIEIFFDVRGKIPHDKNVISETAVSFLCTIQAYITNVKMVLLFQNLIIQMGNYQY